MSAQAKPEALVVAGTKAAPSPPGDVAGVALHDAIAAVLARTDRCSVALAGGTTPKVAYAHLVQLDARAAKKLLPRVDFYFGDERCVAADHADANYKMARAALGADAKLQRIEGERKDRDEAARAYERVLPAALDILVLGIGEDGHTASLFPGSPALSEKTRRVVAIDGAPKPPPERITITPVAIEAARRIIMIATGAAKAEPVQRAIEGPWKPEETPAQLARRGTWILDEAAARLIARSLA